MVSTKENQKSMLEKLKSKKGGIKNKEVFKHKKDKL